MPTETERIDKGVQRFASVPGVPEEQLLQVPCHRHQRIFDIHLKARRIFPVGVQSRLGVVGQDSVQRQQHKMGKQFLFHTTFGSGMEVIDANQLFGDLIQLLN